MSETVEQLRSMDTADLIAVHDRHAQNTVIGTRHYLDELARRDAMDLSQQVAANTKEVTQLVADLARDSKKSGDRMERLTWIILALTFANVGVVVLDAL